MEKLVNEVINNSEVNCVGCCACMNICPKKAISMEENLEGFLYPNINKDKCIGCNLCENVCPAIDNPIQNNKSITYAYCTSNKLSWINSTSGGAFTDICNIWEKNNPNSLYYGATINNNEVKHICVKIDELDKIKKSKYIQSKIGYTFIKIRKELNDGKSVVFSGTPCQVAALRNFLKKEHENLLLIDIVCHGVGSEDVFKNCLEYEEKRLKGKIDKYTFRYKKNNNFKASCRYNVEYILNNGERIINKDDAYMQLFLNGSCLRNSCANNCKFKAINSYSDISLADLNYKSKIIPFVYDKRNYSAIFLHNEDKKNIINELKGYGNLLKCDEKQVLKYNKVYKYNNDCTKQREAFFDKYLQSSKDIDIILKSNDNTKKKLNLIDFVPYFIKYIVNVCKETIINGRK